MLVGGNGVREVECVFVYVHYLCKCMQVCTVCRCVHQKRVGWGWGVTVDSPVSCLSTANDLQFQVR